MSDCCCSPLGPSNTPPGAAFYQTILDADSTALPQEPALRFSNDFVLTDEAPDDTHVALAGALLPAVTGANNTEVLAVVAGVWTPAPVQPFRGTFHVDPAFVGTSSGSASNPFTTVAAAFAAAAALALAGATLLLPPATTLTENVVFPATGGSWEISSTESSVLNAGTARIVGTVTANNTSAGLSIFALSSGLSSSGVGDLTVKNVVQVGTITLTTSGAGAWVSEFAGPAIASPNKLGGSTSGLVNIAGQVHALNWVFTAGVTDAPIIAGPNPPFVTMYRGCQFGSVNGVAVPIGLGGTALVAHFWDCNFIGPTTFTATNANYQLSLDAASLASVMRVGVVLTGTNLTLKTLNSNASDTRTVANNLGSTNYAARAAAGLYEIDVEMTLLVAGGAGSAGLLQLNAIYTDLTGTLITAPVLAVPLDITGAVGSKQQGALRFQHNGAVAPIAFSLTGIVTPGTMSVAVASAIQRRN
jgi:putative Mn2+ efflux pump MntP